MYIALSSLDDRLHPLGARCWPVVTVRNSENMLNDDAG